MKTVDKIIYSLKHLGCTVSEGSEDIQISQLKVYCHMTRARMCVTCTDSGVMHACVTSILKYWWTEKVV